MLTVSIIITVCNGAEYLQECLVSVLAQTLKNIEIICVDDASTDNTPQILKAYDKAKSCEADICIFKEDLFSDSIEKRTNYAYVESFMKKLDERAFFLCKR